MNLFSLKKQIHIESKKKKLKILLFLSEILILLVILLNFSIHLHESLEMIVNHNFSCVDLNTGSRHTDVFFSLLFFGYIYI